MENANYAWLQHILHHLAPNGSAGVVLANGSMSSGQSAEGDIRRAMLEADVVDCMVALPGQFFYSTQIPTCVWFLSRNKNPDSGWRDRRGEATLEDVRGHGHVLTPGRYVGAGTVADDDLPYEEQFGTLLTKMQEQFASGEALQRNIQEAPARLYVR